MAADARLTYAFETHRAHLMRVAYGTLGSVAEAEDVLQEAWLRLERVEDPASIRDPRAWLTTVVGRLALDALGSARMRREAYVGPWLPEPLVRRDDEAEDPADRVTLDDSVSYALMVVLETLSPAERVVWVLHEVFGMPLSEVAGVVGRTPAAVRQLAVRARRHVRSGAPRVDVDATAHARTVTAFLTAAGNGDLAGLLALLDPDVVLTSDGGGVVNAARRPVLGAERVARFLLGIAEKTSFEGRVEPAVVNNGPGLAFRVDGRLSSVAALTVVDGRVTRVDIVLAPAKLGQA